MTSLRFLSGALASCLGASALAGEDAYRLSAAPARVEFQPNEAAPTASSTNWWSNPGEFTRAGSTWLTLGGGVAPDFTDNTDYNAFLAWSKFLVDDVEFMLELGGWYHDQPDDDAFGFNPNLVFRWHFLKSEDLAWTVYADAGVGLLLATDDVPQGGTNFNLMPRAGAGVTRRITDDGARLILGVRWHHISNARINGQDENPSRDALMFYAGVTFPF
ncbi:MAG TPA: acyloxyacyl hydrolase [Phycisphaerales bacterium]|nr:acyloxyacyl hydrolase [Phycisphaerales bacterium]